MAEIVAEFSQLARRSPHINQRSGVSVRLTVANLETLAANAMRRSLLHGETLVTIVNRNAIWNCGWPGPELDIVRNARQFNE